MHEGSERNYHRTSIKRSSVIKEKSSPLQQPRIRPFAVQYSITSSTSQEKLEKSDKESKQQQQQQQQQHVTTIPLSSSPDLPVNNGPLRSHKSEVPYDNSTNLTLNCLQGARNNPVRSPIRLKENEKEVSVNSLRRRSEEIRRASKTPSGGFSDTLWAGHKLAGRVIDSNTSNIKRHWEQNIQQEQIEKANEQRLSRPRPYGFPKWRSTDALSASLVASNPVEIPRDSRIPEQRVNMMKKTDQEAMVVKEQIQAQAEPSRSLHKGKSLDSLVMQHEYNPWYDRDRIRESVSRESVANIGLARTKFENGSIRDRSFSTSSSRFDMPLPPPPPVEHTMQNYSYHQPTSYQNFSTPAQMQNNNNNNYEMTKAPPPLPPKSEEIQIRQANHTRPDMQNGDFRNSHYSLQNGDVFHAPQQNSMMEEQLLMLYMKQNPQVFHNLGVSVPEATRQIISELPWRRVELRLNDDDFSQTQSGSPSNQRGGRYVKKQQTAPPTRFSAKNGTRRVGEALIAEEIRVAREREDELKRSRSELGLPNLEDSLDMWRNGYRTVPSLNPLRTALSYDHIHQKWMKEIQIILQHPAEVLQKTNSTGELWRENDRNGDSGSRSDLRGRNVQYRLHDTDDQDVMFFGPSRKAPIKRFD